MKLEILTLGLPAAILLLDRFSLEPAFHYRSVLIIYVMYALIIARIRRIEYLSIEMQRKSGKGSGDKRGKGSGEDS